jgi:hypothetical protein
MLALGPHGWARVLGFALAGAGILASVPALARVLPGTRFRVPAVAAVGVMGAAVLLSAAKADPSMLEQQDPTTWHGTLHGLMFLLLLLLSLLAPLLVAAASAGPEWRSNRRVSLVLPVLVVVVLSAGLANLGFYVFLCLLMAWTGWLAVRASRSRWLR